MSKILTIGELAKITGLNPKTIRYYEDLGLIAPERAQNGYRIFRAKHEHDLLFIKRAKMLGFTLTEIGVVLQDVQSGLCLTAKKQIKDLISEKMAEIDNQVNELNELKQYLTTQIAKIEKSGAVNSEAADCSCLGDK